MLGFGLGLRPRNAGLGRGLQVVALRLGLGVTLIDS